MGSLADIWAEMYLEIKQARMKESGGSPFKSGRNVATEIYSGRLC